MYKELFDLSGRVAVVTGGSRGIGEAIATALSEFGAKLVLVSRKIEGLEDVRQKIEAAGGEAVCVPVNMGNEESSDQVVKETLDAYGTLDILVNNAATNPIFGPMMDVDVRAWDKIMSVNLKGCFLLAKAAGEVMLEKGRGSIINMSTISARRPLQGLGAYSVSKAGIDMVTKSLAQEWTGSGVRVNGIAPGLIQTNFSRALWENNDVRHMVEARIPARRLGQPDDIAGAAVFLASDASRFISGETILVDGGLYQV
ncbi:MAG: glucose 1-dehydrogenase [Actinobacteria bacterium]|nr:glucose 1-dehydrogenase [Actinomycetota bacterium]